MQLSAVLLARAFFFIETTDLNPRGTAFYPDVIRGLVERYSFQKFPQKFEELDETKGVEFALGKIGEHTIQKVVIYSHGLSLDTCSSTQDSEAILDEALTWAAKTFGIRYQRDMVKRKGYVSQVSFYSEAPLLFVNPILKDFSGRVSKTVSANLKLESLYEPSAILLSTNPETQRIPAATFSIERRAGTAYSEGKYFSVAPLPTDTHIAMLEEFERTILTQNKDQSQSSP